MKPLLLEIRGLGSFSTTQVIDFENLTSSGLFGIFGKTGSGKSTILDSLTLALYNKVDRYDKDKSEMVNLNSRECYVSLVFSVKNQGEDIIYKVERGYRLDPHGSLKIKKHILSQKDGDIYTPVVEGQTEVNVKLESIIGLNYDDFTKAVILPQGKFNQFINLDGNDRRKMLERIFGLEEYGERLSKKYNILLSETDTECKVLSEKYSVYNEYTVENKKEVEKRLKEIEKELVTLTKNNTILNENKVSIDKDIENATKLKNIKLELNNLEQLADEINDDKLKFKSKDVVTKVNVIKEKLNKQNKELLTLKNENEQHKQTLGKAEKELVTLDKDTETLTKTLEDNKKNLLEIKIDTDYLQEVNGCIQQEENLKIIEKDITTSENELEINNKHKLELDNENTKLQSNISRVKENIELLKASIVNTKNDKEYWEKAIKVVETNVKNKQRFDDTSEKVYLSFDEEIKIILKNEQNIEKFEQEIIDFKFQNLAVTLAEKLTEGQPCPVCGSVTHPNVVKALEDGFVEAKQEQIKISKENKTNSEKNIEKYLKGLQKRVDDFVEKHISLEKDLETLNAELKLIEQKVIENTSEIKNIEKNDNRLLENIKELSSRRDVIVKNINIIRDKYNLQTSFVEESQKIKNQQDLIKKLENSIELYNNELKAKLETKDILKNKISDFKVKVASSDSSIIEVNKNIQILNEELETVLVENNITREQLLQLGTIDFESLEIKITNYENNLVVLQSKYSEFKEFESLDLGSLMQQSTDLENELKATQRRIEEITTEKGSTQEKINVFDIKLKEKDEVLQNLTVKTKKLDDILSIKSLLQGKKFVEFIARKDLEEVVFFASEEFNKLSNGKYFLKLSDTNLDIEVVDNLQGGKRRSIKSLSGGETFIISLCLSLSLSKKIQMKKNSIIEFFFLDEGFGSLDNEALDNVTDSLMSLKNSNINIGIITHVDKLKERVPKALAVSNGANGTEVRIV